MAVRVADRAARGGRAQGGGIESAHRAARDERLAGFQAVDAGQDVDGVGAEGDEGDHVEVVEGAEVGVGGPPGERDERCGQHHARAATVRHHQRQGGDSRQHQLDAPGDVEHVVRKAEEEHEGAGGQGGIVVHVPRVWQGVPPSRPGAAVQVLEDGQAGQEDGARGEAGGFRDAAFAGFGAWGWVETKTAR